MMESDPETADQLLKKMAADIGYVILTTVYILLRCYMHSHANTIESTYIGKRVYKDEAIFVPLV